MKRIMACLLAVVLTASSCWALAEGNWVLEEGESMARRIQALAADENYQKMLIHEEKVLTLLKGLAEADFSKPEAAYMLPIPERDELAGIIRTLGEKVQDAEGLEALLKLSEEAKEELMRRIPSILVNALVSRHGGMNWVAMNSSLSTGRSFVEPEGFTPCILVLEYPGEYAVALLFAHAGEGVVSVSASVLPMDAVRSVSGYLQKMEGMGISLELRDLLKDD